MKLEVIQLEMESKKIESRFIRITRESGIPLIGHIAFGILDRGTSLLQVRCTTVCNANCQFCSTDGGPNSKFHKTNYIVDIDYLTEEVEKLAKIKGNDLIIFLDSVGEPTTHPNFIELVACLKQIQQVKEIIVITNGTLLTKEKIDNLEKAGLTRINLSFHSIDPELSKKLFGMPTYNVNKTIELIKYIKQNTKIDLMLTPVWLPNINDKEIVKIINLCKEFNCKIGLQNYETYKYSRKMKGAKKQTYWKFYNKIKLWEKDFDIKLIMKNTDLGIEKRPRMQEVFSIGEKTNVKIVCSGWYPNQMIGVARNRCISINNCEKTIGETIKVKILENKNNIYIAE